MKRKTNSGDQMRSGAALEHGKAHSVDHQQWSRRSFLQTLGVFGVGTPLALGSKTISPLLGRTSLASQLMDLETDRVLVLLQIKGGWDGLSAVIPISSQAYYDARPDIAYATQDVISLSPEFGLHQDLGDLQGLWGAGNMSIIHGVSYPNSSLSHFQGTDNLVAGSTDPEENSGWLGRTLDFHYPDFQATPPPAPLAVEISSAASRLFRNPVLDMGMTLRNPAEFYRIAQGGGIYDILDVPPDSYGDELSFLRQIANFTVQYSTTIQAAADLGTNDVTYPDHNLAESLAIVAKLIKGGLGAKVYSVQIGGFDTHADQVSRLSDVFTEVGSSVKAFFEDLAPDPMGQKTTMMTFSEFGRRVSQNSSGGTDHGSPCPVLMFGGNDALNGGFFGEPLKLDPDDLDRRGNPTMTTDFRSIYGSVLNDWMGVDCAPVGNILDFDPETLGLITNPDPASTSCALPIVLDSFEISDLGGGKLRLDWSTLSELDNSGFEIEQLFMDSELGSWTNVGFVEGMGTTNERQSYFFETAVAHRGVYRFRLKQIDFNGAFEYSNRVEVFADLPESLLSLELYPNPFVDHANVYLTTKNEQNLSIQIFDSLGRLAKNLYEGRVAAGGELSFSFQATELAAGSYVLVARTGDLVASESVVIAR